MDFVLLPDGNILHIVCQGTGFKQGIFLNKMSAEAAWRALKQCRIYADAGDPDFLITAQKRKKAAIKSVRVEKVERSHAIVKFIYGKLKIDLPSIRREERFIMIFRAINDAPNSAGISPTMLVFCLLSKIPDAGFRGSMVERANIIRECSKIVVQMNARRIVRDSIRGRKVP